MNLKDKIKDFPLEPGVYRFLDEHGEILYIGRATALRRRVSNYFRLDLDPRIAEMVSLARDVQYEIADSVLEAIILEANLIRKYWPKYNVKEKDDKSFSYVVIADGDYPKPMIVRGRDLNKFPVSKVKIFGPYQNSALLRKALQLIRRVFPYGTCKPNQGKPCFDYQIGLCPGSCVGKISVADYQQNIKHIEQLLSGERKRLLKDLAKSHPEQESALKHLQETTLLTADDIGLTAKLNRIEGYDISHLSGQEVCGSMTVFIDGEPDNSQYRIFKISEANSGDDLRSLYEMLERRLAHQEWPYPDMFLIDGGKPQVDFVSGLFLKKQINIPLIGISKLAGDKLVFGKNVNAKIKKLAEELKKTLLYLRDEAHRFANRARRANMKKRNNF
ncbi:MAG: GIY-YIG nuclease family protein [bacterium]